MADSALAYGDSGSGKTSICIGLSKWIYESFGLTTRLVSVEGWEPVENEGLIKAGIVSAYNLRGAKNFLSATRKISRGYWPKVFKEEIPINDADGIQVGSKQAWVKRIVEDKEEFSKVGLYFIESADGIAEAYMDFIKNEEILAENERGEMKVKAIGPQGTAGRYETDDGEVLGSNSEGHYSVVQTEMHKLFTDFGSLGGNLKLVMWTAHAGMGKMGQTKAKDKDGKKRLIGDPCYCPLLVGEAKNALVPSWVGECFHLEDVPLIVNDQGEISQQKQVKAFYENHREEGYTEGPQYRCKSRVGLSDVEALHEQFPGGYVPLDIEYGKGLEQYYSWLYSRKGANVKTVKEWKERIDSERGR